MNPAPESSNHHTITSQPPVAAQQTLNTETSWQRLHPLTPLFKGWTVIVAIVVFGGKELMQNQKALEAMNTSSAQHFLLSPVALSVIGGVITAGALLVFFQWRYTAYRLTADHLDFKLGIFMKQAHSMPYERIQSIDIHRSLANRLAGIASLVIRVADGESSMKLSYFTVSEAQKLKEQLLQLRRQGHVAESALVEVQEVGNPPETIIMKLPVARLFFASVADTKILFPLLFATATVVGGIVILVTVPGATMQKVVFPLLPIFFAITPFITRRVKNSFNFVSRTTEHGFNMSFGLLTHDTETIPYNRVQAVSVSQPFFWRFFGWWRVSVNVAGKAQGSKKQHAASGLNVVLPVGTLAETNRTLECILASWHEETSVELLVDALVGGRASRLFVPTPPRANIFSPFAGNRDAIFLDEDSVLIRGGFFEPFVSMMPLNKVQAMEKSEGPVERKLKLASILFATTGGSIRLQLKNLNSATVDKIYREENAKLTMALSKNVSGGS